MSLETLLFKIRKRETPFYSKAKDILLALSHLDFIAPKFIFRPMYELVIIWRFLSHFFMDKFLYVPIFRARCERCGKGLSLPNGIPWIEGNLRIIIGDHISIDDSIFVSGRVNEKPILIIGDRTSLGYQVYISVAKSVEIGSDCMIAGGCFIADNDGHPMHPAARLRRDPVRGKDIKAIIIEDNVWIGTRATILKGVTIGKGSIVAANSLVTRSIPPNCIAMGVPARVILSSIDKISDPDASAEKLVSKKE
jgi:acetyltransferase-like isoleucine patch superfamily enzyme